MLGLTLGSYQRRDEANLPDAAAENTTAMDDPHQTASSQISAT